MLRHLYQPSPPIIRRDAILTVGAAEEERSRARLELLLVAMGAAELGDEITRIDLILQIEATRAWKRLATLREIQD